MHLFGGYLKRHSQKELGDLVQKRSNGVIFWSLLCYFTMAEDINIHDVVVPGPDLALDPGQDLPFLLLANGAVQCRLCPAANGQFHQFPTRPLYARHCGRVGN